MNLKLVVAYDGARFHGFAANDGVSTVLGAGRGDRHRCAPARHDPAPAGPTPASTAGGRSFPATCRRASTSTTSRDGSTSCAPVDRRALGDVGGGGLQCPLLGRVAAVPLRDLERLHTEPAHPHAHVVRRRTPRRPGDERWRPALRRGARLRVVLPATEGSRGSGKSPGRSPRPPADTRAHRDLVESGGHRPERPVLRFEIRANAFCHQMVRSTVGTLVEVGAGKRSATTCWRSSRPATARLRAG